MEESNKISDPYRDSSTSNIASSDNCHKEKPEITQPLPESSRPRKDGPGGEGVTPKN